MVYINEWMPNPTGADTVGSPSQVLSGKTWEGEWVELFNSGQSAVSLNGWSLKSGAGKKVFLKNYTIGPGNYLVLKRTDTKLTLRNTNETLFLYDNTGRLIDQSGFLGSAPEGKSFSRISSVEAPSGVQNFIFTESTPGQPNTIVREQNFLTNNVYPFGQPLNNSLGYFDVLAMAVSSALLFAFFITILLKRNDYLSKLFFSRD